MKLRNYFFGALACLALASCSSDDDAVDSGQKDGVACIAVKLVMPGTSDVTRADNWNDDPDTGTDDTNNTYYQEGAGNELVVSNVLFCLFDDSDQLTKVVKKVADDFDIQEAGTANIEQVFKDAVIVLTDEATPKSIVAVLNAPAALETVINNAAISNMALTNFTQIMGNLSGCGAEGLVMSNSVYVDGNSVIQATAVAGNIGYGVTEEDAAEEAKKKPVTIPVERVLARVHVDENASSISNPGTPITLQGESTPITIIPEIQGWWLDNTNTNSYLIKQLEATYTFVKNISGSDMTAGWWNDKSDFRSYWADAYASSSFGHYTWGSNNSVDKYCFENTDIDDNTQIVVAAILKKGGVVVNLIQWGGMSFDGTDAFFEYVAKTLTKYKKLSGSEKVAITKDDLELIYNDNSLDVKYDNETKSIKDWQSLLNFKTGTSYYMNDNATPLSASEIIDNLKRDLGTIKYYNGGQTYYFTKIEHEPNYEETDYAIIRNHIYKLTLNSISGLGTPVPNPDDDPTEPDPTDPTYPDPTDPNGPDTPDPTDPDQPIVPERPEGDHSAISAKVQILKYRVVSQGVALN